MYEVSLEEVYKAVDSRNGDIFYLNCGKKLDTNDFIDVKEIKSFLEWYKAYKQIDKIQVYNRPVNNPLYEVLTFAEASSILDKAPNYFSELAKKEKLIEGIDYRSAGRQKLVLRSVVERIKK